MKFFRAGGPPWHKIMIKNKPLELFVLRFSSLSCELCQELCTWLTNGGSLSFLQLQSLLFPSDLNCSYLFRYHWSASEPHGTQTPCLHSPRPQSLSSRHSSRVRSAEATTQASYGELSSWKVGIRSWSERRGAHLITVRTFTCWKMVHRNTDSVSAALLKSLTGVPALAVSALLK